MLSGLAARSEALVAHATDGDAGDQLEGGEGRIGSEALRLGPPRNPGAHNEVLGCKQQACTPMMLRARHAVHSRMLTNS